MSTYRRLAREWHPDKNQHRRAEAEQTFAQIAKAYDILKDTATREAYDYALEHPDRVMYNAFRYYKSAYVTNPKVLPPSASFVPGLDAVVSGGCSD